MLDVMVSSILAESTYVLSRRQTLVWLEHALSPRLPRNVMVGRFDIQAPLDHDRLRAAFDDLVAAIPVLRTVLEGAEDLPVQRVLDRVRHRPPTVDLSTTSNPDQAADAWIRSHSVEPLDLRRRLFDAAILRLRDNHHVLVLRQHHLITDATSFAILFEHLAAAYEGRERPVTEPFTSFLRAEADYHASTRHTDDAAFWRARIGEPPPTTAFYGHTTPERGGRLIRRVVRIGAERQARLDTALGRARGTPLASLTRHALYATTLFALLRRITGQHRLGIGSPLANRTTPELRRVVGLVMEQSPILVDVHADDTFASLYERVRADLMSVLGHGRYCVSNPSGHRLYDAVLNMHTQPMGPFGDLAATGSITPALCFADTWPEGIADGGEALAITVASTPGGDDELAFDLNRDVFDERAQNRVIDHFLRMLDAHLEDRESPIREVSLFDADDARIALAQIVPRSAPTVLELIAKRVAQNPSAVAVRFSRAPGRDIVLDYRTLWARVGGVAAALRREGVGPGDRVAVALDRSERLPVALLGTLAAGAAYVPLDPDHPDSRLRQIVEDASPRVVITEAAVSERLALGLPVVDLESTGIASVEGPAVDGPAVNASALDPSTLETGWLNASALAYVLFTSGSTGRPKGVDVPHRALGNFLCSMAHTPGLDADDHLLAVTTPSFDIAALELFLPLVVGGTVTIADRDATKDPERLAALLTSSGATVMQATPATWRLLVESDWPGDPGLMALSGGEPLPPDLAEALLDRVRVLYNLYGPTETTIWSTVHLVERAEAPISIGRPIDQTVVRVVDDSGALAPVGTEGELWIGGDGVALGYRGLAELTAERFVRPWFDPEGRYYRTGDRGRWRSDGTLECLGRQDGQIKIRGFRVELGEIECALRGHAHVKDAAVVMRGDAGDAALVAHVVTSGDDFDLESLRQLAAEQLPSYMVPARWNVLDALPLNPSGKIDRRALERLGEGDTPGARPTSSSEAPRDDTDVTLAALFAEVMEVPDVGIDDDFYDLGGHSLAALKIAHRIRQLFGVELPVGLIFSSRTVRLIADHIRAGGSRRRPTVIPLARGAKGSPVFCVCGVQIYHALAQRIGTERPVYGVYLPIEERAIERTLAGEPLDITIEQMAAAYLEILRERQPKGPYTLLGLSFGGLLAFEMAQQLRRLGETVRNLTLLDTVLPQSVRRRPVPWVVDHARLLADRSRFMRPEWRRALDQRRAVDPREKLFINLMRGYRMRQYDGSVLLVRAEGNVLGPGRWAPPDHGFGRFCSNLRIVDVPGGHVELLHEPNVETLAETLRPFLRA